MHYKALLTTAAAAMLLAPAARASPPKKTPDLIQKGAALFNTNCASCHGPTGEGNGPAAAKLDPKPRNYTSQQFKNGSSVENIFDTLGKGVPGSAMVAFTQLSEQERWALAYYVLELKAKGKKR